LDTSYEVANIHLELGRDDWTFRLWAWKKNNSGIYAGVYQALAPGNTIDSEQLIAELKYGNDDLLNRDLEINARFSFLYGHEDAFLELLPAGAIVPVGTDGNLFSADTDGTQSLVLFSEGVFGNPEKTAHHYSIDFSGNYKGVASHNIRLGTGYQQLEEDTEEYKNFGPGTPLEDPALPAFSIVDGSLTHVSQEDAYMSKQDRRLWYMSLQDEWAFAKKWELTAGIRYDHYSDFGNTINPRIALVWESRFDLVTKLLYGHAFRPPSFNDLYTKNNPINQGNSDLDPETIKMLELAFDYQPTAKINVILNFFTYEINDLIELVADNPAGTVMTAQNARDQKGKGFELEADWRASDTFRLRGNIAFQRSKDKDTKQLVAEAPEKQFYINPHWEFLPNWSLDGQFYWIADRHRNRASGDTRPEIDNYELVHLTLRKKNLFRHWDLAVAIRNLFDEDVREPSQVAIPNDFPMEGRSVWTEARFYF
jgi:iron complex outermembrane receptor protein